MIERDGKKYCQSRIASGRVGDDEDVWEKVHDGVDTLFCSFCGSIHPDAVPEFIKDGCKLENSDKPFKLDLIGPGDSWRIKLYSWHLTRKQSGAISSAMNKANSQG